MNGRIAKLTGLALTCTASIWTLSGCGTSDRPTVRQTKIAQSEAPEAGSAASDHEPNSLERALERAQADGTAPDFAGFDHAAHAGLPNSALARLKNRERNRETSSSSDEGAAESDPHAGARSGRTGKANGAAGEAPGAANAAAAAGGPANTARTDNATSGAASDKSTSATRGAGKPVGDTEANAAAPTTAVDDPRVVSFGGFQMTAPENWEREEPPVTFILAAFQLPGSRGAASNAQLTVTLPVNNDQKSMSRLRDQIREEIDGGESKVERLKLAGHEAILVDSTVEEDNDGENSPATVRKGNYRSLNAMLFIGNSVYFLNCTGPERTVATHYTAYREFLQTLKTAQ